MTARHKDDRPVYERSGRVALMRFWPAALATLLVALTMAYVWVLAYHAGLGYWLATPVVLVLPVAIAAYLAVVFGRCRNCAVAAILGIVAALVFHLGYFHADLVHQNGRQALLWFDLLPEFIGSRMANDGIQAQRQLLPRSETYNWLYAGAELLVISLIVTVAAVFPSLRGFCESCHRWMRSVAFHAEPGRGRDIADALASGELWQIPETEGQFVRIAEPQSWLEFEYCPGACEPGTSCAAYLTLKDHIGFTEHADVLMYQGRLTQDELASLARRVRALAFLELSAPTADSD